MTRRVNPRSLFSPDVALGATGCFLAVSSAAFGLYMVAHGPVATLGTSKDFTIFAQLTHGAKGDGAKSDGAKGDGAKGDEATDHGSSGNGRHEGEALDMTTTASIPRRTSAKSRPASGDPTILPSITLESADGDKATVAIDGRPLTVRVGDFLPGAGEVTRITPGVYPEVWTSRGLVLSAGEN